MNEKIKWVAILIVYIICFSLIIHHGYYHRPSGKDPLYGLNQYFQLSDVGNFKTFSHEMFVIAFFFVGCVLFWTIE